MTREQIERLAFIEPTEPELSALMNIHPSEGGERGKGVVLFTNDGSLRPFAAMTPGKLAELLPGLLPEFDRDSYYTLSRFKTPPKTGKIPPGYAAREYVSHLTAAWVDIDYHKAPGGALEMWQVMSDVLRAVERGAIPSPSCYVDSGRGLWLLWKVHPVELATPAAMDLLERINRRAVEMFARLGADRKSTNVSRWTRIPGSINSKSGKRASYLFAGDDEGRPISYTLAELADLFNVTECPLPAVFTSLHSTGEEGKRPRPGRGEKDPAKVRAGCKGWRARARNIGAALVHLSTLRRGFREGTRELACHYMAWHLLRAGYSIPDVLNLLLSPGMFSPSLTPSVIRKHVTAAALTRQKGRARDGSPTRIAQQTIADRLDISPNEARQILGNIGITFPHRWQNQLQAPAPALSKREQIDARRERVRAIVERDPALTDRAIVEELRTEGYPASLQTIQRDLKELPGIVRPRRRQRPEPPPELPL
jgi:hypothetical protein